MNDDPTTRADLAGLLSLLGVPSVDEAAVIPERLATAEAALRCSRRELNDAKQNGELWRQQFLDAEAKRDALAHEIKTCLSGTGCGTLSVLHLLYLEHEHKLKILDPVGQARKLKAAEEASARAVWETAEHRAALSRMAALNKAVRSERNRALKALSILKDIQFDRLTKEDAEEQVLPKPGLVPASTE
jgi:hypothetical protein